jgi:arylsulfatase A-like enzyme
MMRLSIAAVVLAAVFCLNLSSFAAEASRPNILFIMADDHGYQAISAYGSRMNKTPHIDRLAKEGMRFDRCFVTNSICGPSRATILTGKYSHLNGFIDNNVSKFNGAQPHVAKYLQAAGYQTAMIGKWHLVTDPTGFDHWEILQGQGPYYNPPMKTAQRVVKHTGYTTEIIADLAVDWLKHGRDKSKPFFLMCHHKATHREWLPGPKQLDHYRDVQIPEPETLFDDYSGRGEPAKNQQMTVAKHLNATDLKFELPQNLTPQQRQTLEAAYAEENAAYKKDPPQGKDDVRWKFQRYAKDYLRCVDAVDDAVGKVLDTLDELGLTENTLVVYTSDQGWYLGEHGWYDKRWMYEESFRTPLLVRWRGHTKQGSVDSHLVMNLDFAETFLAAAGLPIQDDMQGRSLVPLLDGKSPADWRKDVYYRYYEFPQPHHVEPHYGVRNERYKLIYFNRIKAWELYDLEKDPHEMQNVYGDQAYGGIVEQMKQRLEALRKQYRDDDDVVKEK